MSEKLTIFHDKEKLFTDTQQNDMAIRMNVCKRTVESKAINQHMQMMSNCDVLASPVITLILCLKYSLTTLGTFLHKDLII